jgi:hypothetical protein
MFTRILGITLGAILAFAALKYLDPSFTMADGLEALKAKLTS